jgi:hypothetical protein
MANSTALADGLQKRGYTLVSGGVCVGGGGGGGVLTCWEEGRLHCKCDLIFVCRGVSAELHVSSRTAVYIRPMAVLSAWLHSSWHSISQQSSVCCYV